MTRLNLIALKITLTIIALWSVCNLPSHPAVAIMMYFASSIALFMSNDPSNPLNLFTFNPDWLKSEHDYFDDFDDMPPAPPPKINEEEIKRRKRNDSLDKLGI